jgi:23S rRNA pseudouridine955/2504/2580 synthase
MSAAASIAVGAGEGELRLDRWFKRHFPDLTHGRLEKLLRTGQVRVDGKRAKAGLRLAPGQVIRVPPLGEPAPSVPEGDAAARPAKRQAADDRLIAELRRRVLYRDPEVLIIDKPAGLAVQGGTATDQHLDRLLDGLCFEAPERPRLVHRLDRDTSGVLVLGRSAAAAAWLAAAFRHKETRKIYWAVTVGHPKLSEGRIDLALSKQGAAMARRSSPMRRAGAPSPTIAWSSMRAGARPGSL